MEVVGTFVERRFFSCVREFSETSVSKMLEKFLFTDNTPKELAFLENVI